MCPRIKNEITLYLPDQTSQECIDYAYAAAEAEFYNDDSYWNWSENVNDYAWECELNEDEGITSLDPIFL